MLIVNVIRHKLITTVNITLRIIQAKDLVEKAPVVIKTGVKKEEIDAIKKILIDAGATIEIIQDLGRFEELHRALLDLEILGNRSEM